MKIYFSFFCITILPSFFINILYLTNPLYMMHIYDSVIGTQSKINLIALSTITLFLYALFFGFDLIRSRLLIESSHLIERFFKPYIITVTKKYEMDGTSLFSIISSLDQLKQFITSPVLPALLDILFTPIFIILSFCIHPILGSWAILSGILLLTITILFQANNERLERRYKKSRQDEINFGKAILHNSEYIYAPSTRDFLLTYWNKKRATSQEYQSLIAKKYYFGISVTKTLRMTLQSSILGIGAWLVIHQKLSAGAIIATSIITARAMAPLEQIINSKKSLNVGLKSLKYLINLNDFTTLLNSSDSKKEPISMRLSNNTITAKNIVFRDKKTSRLICQNLSFTIPEGSCCIIAGPSGCGKSNFLLCMLGLLTLEKGTISFGDRQISRDFIEKFSAQIGYLSQHCSLFPISITENIILSHDQNSLHIAQKTAKIVGCHEDILSLKNGYQTTYCSDEIPYNIVQKIRLSRIIANNPAILLMDEPLYHLDNEAKNNFYTLLKQFKENKKTIVIISHDPTIISMSDFSLIFHPIQGSLFGLTQDIFKFNTVTHNQIKI
ncbi:Type I secretion system ATP-binding protein PrsD [Candidatus Liberibacter asiaticus]|nr:Type I secretion system ATP-binding protein PrsD [Candidatus Liberibacter asiaticus]KAE9516777.1 Type I secretion system ATP-binding protein PrsD [Candidatus Liberibacter asiaticus]